MNEWLVDQLSDNDICEILDDQHKEIESLRQQLADANVRIAELEASWDSSFKATGGLLAKAELVKMIDDRDARIAELEAGQSEWNAMLEMIANGNRRIAELENALHHYTNQWPSGRVEGLEPRR